VSEEDDHDGFEDELEGDPYAKYVEADDEDTDSEGR